MTGLRRVLPLLPPALLSQRPIRTRPGATP